jgi:hypothetical protein
VGGDDGFGRGVGLFDGAVARIAGNAADLIRQRRVDLVELRREFQVYLQAVPQLAQVIKQGPVHGNRHVARFPVALPDIVASQFTQRGHVVAHVNAGDKQVAYLFFYRQRPFNAPRPLQDRQRQQHRQQRHGNRDQFTHCDCSS